MRILHVDLDLKIQVSGSLLKSQSKTTFCLKFHHNHYNFLKFDTSALTALFFIN